jgi:alanine-glyoxylate transaminase/serine-glyoxylate transaminase/serine-pyruvate transaminase
MLMGTLSGVEMALDLANVPFQAGGVLAAMNILKGNERRASSSRPNAVA